MLTSQYFELLEQEKNHARKKHCVLGPPKWGRGDALRKFYAVWMRPVFSRWGQPSNVREDVLQHLPRDDQLFPGTDVFSHTDITQSEQAV